MLDLYGKLVNLIVLMWVIMEWLVCGVVIIICVVIESILDGNDWIMYLMDLFFLRFDIVFFLCWMVVGLWLVDFDVGVDEVVFLVSLDVDHVVNIDGVDVGELVIYC